MVNYFLLLDLVVVISITVTASPFLRDWLGSSSNTQEFDASANSNDTIQPGLTPRLQHHRDVDHVVNETTSVADKPKPQRTPHQDKSIDINDSSHLRVGNMVELYGEQSQFAVPVIIREIIHKKEISSFEYSLHNVITNRDPSGVAPEFLHPYQVYEDGTEAFCNVGAMRELYLTPCTVVSHSINKGGFISYRVSYSKEGKGLYPEQLPFSRVQRLRKTSAECQQA
eukprot:CAMPEP_0172540858 /NCGR_PEP_ID=MMETSP1067-20121228/11777_1 /TAXON_ID=265564 ORGANISM="Thalassiosira punctigera, Strain Tpunct2005C2" /NCGR_SAMPLE_ID=MMETSP1067 /ASSEMBLY_ACC=CAM_ASM_000444 /LENGTH=225 /DNA_ID=CAMNT_0013326779 /DNA_START=36 /DNA_END=713 /DNA_ORIENTATION=-